MLCLLCQFITGISMTDNTQPRIIPEDPAQSRSCLIGSIGNDHHTGMYAVSHANPAPLMQADPTGAACGIYEGVEYGPVGYGIAAVCHGFRFPVGAGHGTGIEVVPADHYGCLQFFYSDQFIE